MRLCFSLDEGFQKVFAILERLVECTRSSGADDETVADLSSVEMTLAPWRAKVSECQAPQ